MQAVEFEQQARARQLAFLVDRRAFDGADAAWAAGVADGAITGVLTYRFDRRRLLPRDRFDLP